MIRPTPRFVTAAIGRHNANTGRIRAAARWIGLGVGWTLVTAALLVGYGIDSEDVRVLSDFCNGVERWQQGPEFRRVSDEYVRLSHAAMNASPFGVSVTTLIMKIRSVPGLGPQYAVSPTSQAHYDNFTRGELSAYLHLCGEQTMDWVIRDLHNIALRGSTDADVEHFLQSWKMNRPVASDAAAVAGLKQLIAEIDAAMPLEPRIQVQKELETTAIELSARMGYPADLRRLTRAQQHDVYQRLDAHLREHDKQLWRYKQISDLCSGIWAQTFGRDYTMVIDPILLARKTGRIAGPAGVLGLIWLQWKRRRPVADNRGDLAGAL